MAPGPSGEAFIDTYPHPSESPDGSFSGDVVAHLDKDLLGCTLGQAEGDPADLICLCRHDAAKGFIDVLLTEVQNKAEEMLALFQNLYRERCTMSHNCL